MTSPVDPPAPQVGDTVRQRMAKWGGGRHWQGEYSFLGTDEFGHWLGAPAGSLVRRPGAQFHGPAASLRLVPHDGAYLASFNADTGDGQAMRSMIYVDMTSVPTLQWEPKGWTLRAVDLDLDVIKLRDTGEVFVDDRDEFADNQVAYGYPPEIIELAERTAREVEDAVRGGVEPFGSVGFGWLARFAADPS